MKLKILIFLVLSGLFCGNLHAGSLSSDPQARAFINRMVEKHGFSRTELDSLFNQVKIKQSIIRAMNRPAESKPWYEYRKIFVTEDRIRGGVRFWRENRATLESVTREYGVPEEIIVAILGVETGYGHNAGSFRVIDALSTLAFRYPRRAGFFSKELEEFLLLCREENFNPLKPIGSYAGAMGFPQFMPSSFRSYARDNDHDGKRDIWKNRGDVMASVANYFNRFGWLKGGAVAFPAVPASAAYEPLITSDLKPEKTVGEMASAGIHIPQNIAPQDKARLIKLKNLWGTNYWVTLHNFYVITRYNHSTMYAMAVFQLSQEIRNRAMPATASRPPEGSR